MNDRIEDRLETVNDRLGEVEITLSELKSELISEVAKRRRAEIETVRLAENSYFLEEERDRLRMPIVAWNEMRSHMLGGQTGAFRPLAERPRLAYFPFGLFNPYLEIMYSACDSLGWNAGPLRQFSEINSLKAGDLFHLHWTKFVTVNATSAQEADRAVIELLGVLDRAIARGVRLGWSVHEALPHECPFPAAEIALRQGLADRAEFIHTLHTSTVDEVADLYELPTDKVINVPHPLYSGFYPDYVSREAARSQLGLGDEVVFLSFGAIRPYKGIDRLVDAARILRQSDVPPFRVIVAGPTYHSVDMQDLLLAAAKEPTVSVMPTAVPNEHVHVLFRAADLSILPYRAFHNSGVALLSISFGTPVLLPETPVTMDLETTGLATFFTIDDDADLLRQMAAAIRTPPGRSAMPPSVAASLDPRLAASRLASSIGPPR